MNRTTTIILIIGTFCLMLILGFWGLILPQMRKLSSTKATITELEQQADQASKISQQKKANLEKTKQNQELVNVLLPAEDNQLDLSIQIEAAVHTAGATLSSLSVNAPDPGQATSAAAKAAAAQNAANLKKVPISMSLNGSYGQIQQFIATLVRLNRFITIDQVNMASISTPAGGTSDQLNVLLTATAYYMPLATK